MSPRVRSKSPACALCGSTKNVERNHIGGRNHLIWATGPFCRAHHRQFHLLLETAGVNLNYTTDHHERLIRAAKAIIIIECMVLDALHADVQNDLKKKN